MDAGPVLWVLSQKCEPESVRRGRAKPMSGVMKRMGMIFRAKANKALDRAEDPRETLDYSYQKQLELLQKVRRGVADVATAASAWSSSSTSCSPSPPSWRTRNARRSRWAVRTSPARPSPAAPPSSSR
ncbi:hypothetical protein SHIRM173S_04626 [Streptomyces hirsutus]